MFCTYRPCKAKARRHIESGGYAIDLCTEHNTLLQSGIENSWDKSYTEQNTTDNIWGWSLIKEPEHG